MKFTVPISVFIAGALALPAAQQGGGAGSCPALKDMGPALKSTQDILPDLSEAVSK